MAERKLNDQEIARRNKLEKYVELGVKPFGQKFVRTHLTKEVHDKYDSYTEEQLAEVKDTFVLAGRIKFIRKMGKASFFSKIDLENYKLISQSIPLEKKTTLFSRWLISVISAESKVI